MDEATGVYKFASVGELSETVTQLLALGLQYHTTIGGAGAPRQTTGLEAMEQLILQQARDYLAEVREGFAFSVRTTPGLGRRELRFLLDRVLLDWGSVWDELNLDGDSSTTPVPENEPAAPEQLRHQLLAFGMAAVTLGYIPRLPADQITFPHSYSKPPTYSDIPTPTTPGAVLSRIDELERMIGRLMGGDLQELVNRRYGALRRTYGFFETTAHLAHREAERFGIKPKRTQIALL
jgi:hypothetical protein